MSQTKTSPNDDALRQATERAERAEAKLAALQDSQPEEDQETRHIELDPAYQKGKPAEAHSTAEGLDELRKDSMMAHLIDSLEAGKDIGHYGRLVFAMVARHFLSDEEVLGLLTKDRDLSTEQATLMLRQVESRDYNPPKRDRILEWQSEQEFPILPNPEDPDCGNLYRTLKFPDKVFKHITDYQEQKLESGS
jgi:hypothetical protein